MPSFAKVFAIAVQLCPFVSADCISHPASCLALGDETSLLQRRLEVGSLQERMQKTIAANSSNATGGGDSAVTDAVNAQRAAASASAIAKYAAQAAEVDKNKASWESAKKEAQADASSIHKADAEKAAKKALEASEALAHDYNVTMDAKTAAVASAKSADNDAKAKAGAAHNATDAALAATEATKQAEKAAADKKIIEQAVVDEFAAKQAAKDAATAKKLAANKTAASEAAEKEEEKATRELKEQAKAADVAANMAYHEGNAAAISSGHALRSAAIAASVEESAGGNATNATL